MYVSNGDRTERSDYYPATVPITSPILRPKRRSTTLNCDMSMTSPIAVGRNQLSNFASVSVCFEVRVKKRAKVF